MSQYLQYGSAIIASDSLALGRVPSGARLDGQTILDAWQPLRGDFAIVYGRARGPREYAVSVWRLFATAAAAVQFYLTHEDTLPVQATLYIVDDAEAFSLRMADAVCSAQIAQLAGTAVLVNYRFTGARFISDAVPAAPNDTETVKAINQALTAGTVEQAIAFDVAFGAAPRGITLQLSAPDGGVMFGWQIRESTRTAAGFTVDFDAAVPATGYKLTGIAVL